MTLVMAYTILLSATLAAGATLAELFVRSRRMASRWIWLVAMVLLIPVTGFVMLAPAAIESRSTSGVSASLPSIVPGPVASVPAATSRSYLELTDVALTVLWAGASVLVFLAIGAGRWRLARARRRARPGRMHGHPVLLTDDLGPAVAGVRQPVVFVPSWALALDDESQKLLLAHELEHARRRDTTLLMIGAGLTALVPWNPVVWWMARRLRVAVELDCDHRVLAANPGVRRYADLLLVAAEKPRFTASVLAAHLGEQASDLERRIVAMTNSCRPWRSMTTVAAVVVVLAVASCEAPRPEPLAPGANAPSSADVSRASAEPYFEFQVEKPVTRAPGSGNPRYPEILRQAGVEGSVLVSFVVDETGAADVASLKVIKSTHELFTAAVRQALGSMQFTPAELGGRKVKQLVQQPFRFTLPGASASDAGANAAKTHLTEVPVRSPRNPVIRGWQNASVDNANFVILSSSGQLVARYPAKGVIKEVKVDDIAAIEVYKGHTCPVSAEAACPLIRIYLKPGREAAYRIR